MKAHTAHPLQPTSLLDAGGADRPPPDVLSASLSFLAPGNRRRPIAGLFRGILRGYLR